MQTNGFNRNSPLRSFKFIKNITSRVPEDFFSIDWCINKDQNFLEVRESMIQFVHYITSKPRLEVSMNFNIPIYGIG